MTNMFGHHPWTVQDLVSGVASGTVRLPDIQRPFVWSNAKVRDLIDSMYQGFPVGELMFWANNDGEHAKTIGEKHKSLDATMQVIDGQQRLTSLYSVLKGLRVWREDYTRESIRLAFNPMTGRFEVATPIFERSSDWISDIVSVFKDPITARSAFFKRRLSDKAEELSDAGAIRVETAINQLYHLQDYEFQVVQVRENVSRATVAEIFVRINSEGVSLQSADFILTWMSVFWEAGRTQLEDFARDSRFTPQGISEVLHIHKSWTPHNPYLFVTPSQLLRVVVAVGLNRGRLQDAYNWLRGRNPHTRELDPVQRHEALNMLKAGQAQVLNPLHWDEYLKVLERAGFRSREMITSQNTVMYTYALWLLGRVRFKVPVDQLREVAARWFFMSQLTGRYTNSPETKIKDDLSKFDDLKPDPASFIAALNERIEAAVPADWWTVTLTDNLVTSSTGAPAYVGYIAALNILDADVLLSHLKVKDWLNPHNKTMKGIEKHHLFPKDYLKSKLDVHLSKRINQVTNYALVEWSDNIDISNDPPEIYWPEQIAGKNIDAKKRIRQEQWHALPDGWTTMGYEDFLTARRSLMAKVTHEGFKKLSDPSYIPDLARATPELSAAELLLPSLADLVSVGTLPVGTLVTALDKEGEVIGEITEDAQLKVGEHTYSSPDQAAREYGSDIGDGWDYWLAVLDGTSVPFASLRPVPSGGGHGE